MSTQTPIDENAIRSVVQEVLGRLGQQGASLATATPAPAPGSTGHAACSCQNKGKSGVFERADDACAAAATAFEQLRKKGYAGRAKVVEIVKSICTEKAQEWGKLEFDETKIGRLEHKIEKLQGIKTVPGVEWITPYGMSGDRGIAMEEHTPFGVVGAITPVTHSIPTLACNIINIVAAGNTVVFNAHPGGAKCAAAAVAYFNDAFKAALGIENIATIIEKPTVESFEEICASEHVKLLCVTGGPGIVKAAMKSGKRAICAGPGNPPVVVDKCARLDKAAEAIILGGAYDNNLLCIGEKQIFVLDEVYDQFLRAFNRAGAVMLNDSQLDRLTKEVFTFKEDGGGCSHPVLNRGLVGADASRLASVAGTSVPAGTELLFAETDAEHLFVIEEQMMPMVPVVRCRTIDEAIEKAYISEHGYKHSSMIHTLNVEHMTAMAKRLDSTLFVKNGACVAGLGVGGEGYPSFSIATTTGEGITTPMTFTRTRRCVMVDNLNVF